MAKPTQNNKVNGLKAKLAKMKARFEASKKEARSGGYEDWSNPDGKYLCQLNKCEIKDGTTSDPNKLLSIIDFKVVAGEHVGAVTPAIMNDLGNEDRYVWLLRDLAKLGVEIDEVDVEALPDTYKELLDAGNHYIINVKTKGEYTNANIVKAIDPDEVESVIAEYGGTAEAEAEAEPEAEAEAEPEAEPEAESSELTRPKGWKPTKGARVLALVNGDPYPGVIDSCPPGTTGDKGSVHITFDDGDELTIPSKDVFPEPEAQPEAKLEEEAEADAGDEIIVGTNLWWKSGKDEFTGTVKSVNGTKYKVLLEGTKRMVEIDGSKIELSILA